MRSPLMSGHCGAPSPGSHERCEKMGAGQRANPDHEFQPCPDGCHFDRDCEQYECESCGGVLIETTWPNDDPEDVDEDGVPYPVYTHMDVRNWRALGQECPL